MNDQINRNISVIDDTIPITPPITPKDKNNVHKTISDIKKRLQIDKQNIADISNRLQNMIYNEDPRAIKYFIKGTNKKGLGLHHPDFYEDTKKVRNIFRKLNMIKKTQ